VTALPFRRRLTLPVVGAVLALGLLAGCTGSQKTPDSYTDSVEEHFLDGCNTTVAGDKKANEGEFNDVPADFCQCAYDALSNKKTGVPFSEFKKINSELTEEAGPLPESFTKVYADCY